MVKKLVPVLILLAVLPHFLTGCFRTSVFVKKDHARAALLLKSPHLGYGFSSLRLEGLYYETGKGRIFLPAQLTSYGRIPFDNALDADATLPDGHRVTLKVTPDGDHFNIRLAATPAGDIKKWGFAIPAHSDEYFSGVMERLVDGSQTETWKPGRTEALNLRGQKIQFLIKPTLSLYAPFYLSSRGYALFIRGTWPGQFDFCASHPGRVQVEFEGPALDFKVYTAGKPAQLVSAHALDAGPPVLPPKWAFTPWRWRDKHSNRSDYFDGTPVTAPYNSQVMEDVLLMGAYGIPCGVYWLDRPWGTGRMGYDDFEIDPKRFPEFPAMVDWLNRKNIRTLLWIAPFTQGAMASETLARHFNYPVQNPKSSNYPLVDLTNPQAKGLWQAGVAKLLKLGVAGFKLDRSEEDIPDRGEQKVADGRTLTENRNDYPVQYVRATYEIAHQARGDDFILLPRAANTGSSRYAAFWGGDIGCSEWGLRASIIGVQRAALMGYPLWGSDTCGYNGTMDREVCGRWLAFSCFTPIMEVGPTQDRAFWDMPGEPHYDAELIAIWRLYARLHQRLVDCTQAYAKEAHATGMPIVRPLFLAYPAQKEAWKDWGTYLYGPDFLVSPVWAKGETSHSVYLPKGEKWQYAWQPEKIYSGGQTVIVKPAFYQIPLFVRVDSGLTFGDLNKEYRESLEIAKKQPDLSRLDADLRGRYLSQHPLQVQGQ